MNPTILHHSSTFDLPLTSDAKYLRQDHSNYNLGGYPANDLTYLHRRAVGGLTNTTPSSSLALPTNSGLDFNAAPTFSDPPYHANPQALLSPPDSILGSASTSSTAITSPFSTATLPRPYASNASGAEHYPGASSTLLSSSRRDSAMTGLERPTLLNFHPPLSPPHIWQPANSMSGFRHPTQGMDRPFGPYNPAHPIGTTFGQRAPDYPYRPAPSFGYTPGPMPQPPPEPIREGPPFGDTVIIHHPLTSQGITLRPEIVANIQKGFFQVDEKWTCYRRNYFTVACSFNFGSKSSDGHYYLKHGHDKQTHVIQSFCVTISAKTAAANNSDSETRGLVQHTPKRNKESESIPTKHIIIPATPQQSQHQNGALPLGGSLYGGPPAHHGYHYSSYHDAAVSSAPTSYTFERIQFQKATANNGKRRAQQQYFHVVVELYANIARKSGEQEPSILIATKESDQMVVRGRSPGHYKDNNRRDSQTSMDPDRGNGPGSDGSSGPYHYGSSHDSSTHGSWPNHQHSGYYTNQHHQRHGENGYRACLASELSPPSASSSTTLTGSPTDLDFALSEVDTLKSSDTNSVNHSRFTTPPSEAADEVFFSLARASKGRKRPLEEDSADEGSPYACSHPFTEGLTSSVFDFPTMAPSKILCTS